MRLPKITVVTPSFNQARFLEQTIVSVIDQEYPRLEYIIIDGGSTDGSRDIIEKHAHRLTYWCSEPDRGQAHALRKGFELATGDVLCWLNSDDVYLPGALLAVGTFFANHDEVEVLNGGGIVIDENSDPVLNGFWTYTEGVAATCSRLKWYGQDGVFQMSTFWRKTAYEAVGGINPELFFLMDKDLFTRLAQRRRFNSIPRLLACFRMHESSKTSLHQNRRHQEEIWFRTQYSHCAGSAVVHPALYSWYRAQSLWRKARSSGALKWGLKRLDIPVRLKP